MKRDTSKVHFGLGEPYDDFGKLLKAVRKNAGFTSAQIAKLIGVHSNSQSFYETKGRDPGIDYLVKYSTIVEVPFWQLVSRRVELGPGTPQEKHRVLNEVGPLLRYFNQRYQGYRIAEPQPEQDQAQTTLHKMMNACQALIERYENQENILVVNHDGSSMSPTINDGDTMVVDTSAQTLTEGDVFIFKNGEVYSAKRVQLLPGGGVMLIPDNAQYQPLKLTAQDVEALEVQGKLVSSISHY